MKHIIGIAFLTLVLALFALPVNVLATIYSGSLSTDGSDPGLIGTDGWDTGLTFSWTVDDTTNAGYWTFQYAFSADVYYLSHIIIEVSDAFTDGNVKSGTSGSPILGYYDPSDPSNPYLPSSFKGLKWEEWNDQNPIYITLVTDKEPVWGDVYAKDGKHDGIEATFYNKGFDDPDPDPSLYPASDGSVGYHALVPDTGTNGVTEPGTLILLGSGLAGLAGYGKLRFRRKRS